MHAMNGRTRIVVSLMGLMYITSWLFSLAKLLGLHFWDQKYALAKINDSGPQEIFYNSTCFLDLARSYLTSRYIWFFPHVACAIVWWNLYFVQLIPSIRRRSLTFHRWMGRLLLLVALAQVVSGLGLACTSHSSVIKSVSFMVAISVAYCVWNAWTFARARDIRRHRYWSMRLVGYLQTIAAQRFWMVVLIGTHHAGATFFYQALRGDEPIELVNSVVMRLFDDSFVLAFSSAVLLTEWYLAADLGMLEAAKETLSIQDGASVSMKKRD